jgi:hypothetical protein
VTRASAIQDHALFRFGDGQYLSVISGAPVAAEQALHFGNEDIWDGYWGFHVAPAVVGYIRPDFVGRLRAGTSTGPSLLPLTSAGTAASPIGSRAALHFSAGDSLVGEDFGLGQHTDLGVQLWVRCGGDDRARIGWCMWEIRRAMAWASGRWTVSSRACWRMESGSVQRRCRSASWQHLALVRQGGISTLYLNGQAMGPTSTAADPGTESGLWRDFPHTPHQGTASRRRADRRWQLLHGRHG